MISNRLDGTPMAGDSPAVKLCEEKPGSETDLSLCGCTDHGYISLEDRMSNSTALDDFRTVFSRV